MFNFDYLITFQFIIFPKFYTVKDNKNNEYVFLKTEAERINSLNLVKDKTQLEGYENHFHLFGKIRKRYQKKVEVVTNLILQNLINELRQNFPNKKFRVYLDCDFSDHVIIRFHQYWEDEHPYYNPDEFPSITEFKIE